MLKPFPALAGFALLALAAAPPRADAAKLMLITHGDQIRELTPAPGAAAAAGGLKVGHVCSYGGLFWVDFWTWGGQYCVFNPAGPKECQVVPPAVAAGLLGVSEGDLPTPFFYRYPLVLLILVAAAVGLGLFLAFGAYANWSEGKLARRLIAQPLYEKAMALPPGERTAYLASEGVPEKEVEANLRALVNTFEADKPAEPQPETPTAPPTPPAAA